MEEEDEEVAGLRAAAAAAAPKKKKKGSEPELPTTCPSIPGGNLLKQELEVAYDVSRAEVPPAGHDAVVGVAPAGPCAADLVDMEELGASTPALPPDSTCLAALSTIQSERGQVCNDSNCYEAWVRSGVVCPTKRLPEVLAGNPSRPGSPRPPGPTRYEIERREWCAATPLAAHGPVGTPGGSPSRPRCAHSPTQLQTPGHIYTRTRECPTHLDDAEAEIEARYGTHHTGERVGLRTRLSRWLTGSRGCAEHLTAYPKSYPGCEVRQAELLTEAKGQRAAAV